MTKLMDWERLHVETVKQLSASFTTIKSLSQFQRLQSVDFAETLISSFFYSYHFLFKISYY
jgi:hypothetical protein